VSSGTLPAGLTLSSAGLLSGSPTASGTFNFAVSVTDASGGNSVTALTMFIASTSPSAPTNLTVTPGPGAGVVAVGFTAPANNGGAASTSYTASCSASGQITRTNTGANSPLTVTNLTNGIAYTCTVAATYSVGTGSA